MNKWIVENWGFDVEVIDGKAKYCRQRRGPTEAAAETTPQS